MAGNSFAKLFVRQVLTEGRLVFQKHINFRKRSNGEAVQAYCAMNPEEFEGINARQRWSNWRTIPRNLDGAIPNRPLFALDLCCGVGHSTEVLAWYLPEGSRILGLEYNPKFVSIARGRTYPHRKSATRACDVQFMAQSVLDPFLDAKGRQLADGSVDLVNSCGAVGSHFDDEATARLAREVARVLRPGGVATIDAGLPGTSSKKLARIFGENGFKVRRTAKSCLLDPFSQICFYRA